MKFFRVLACVLGLCTLWLGAAAPAAAQNYPKGVVKWIVPFPPGGPTDVVGRIVAQQLQETWGQPVVVENKPDVKARLESMGLEVVGSTPEQFERFVRTELVKWAKVIKASNIKVD